MEAGRARLVFAPELELSLPEAQELVSLIERWSGSEGLILHWQADPCSPEVLVEPAPVHFERGVDKLLGEIGGFGRLGTITSPHLDEPGRRPGRALVVASDDAIREIAVMFLSVIGLEVEEVPTGLAATERIKETEYDLLVVGNAELGSMDVEQLLRALEPYLVMTTPVIFWTGALLYDAMESLKHLRSPLMLMSKPNDFHDFRDKVGRALEWRHLIRLRRRVRAHIEDQVAERVRRIEADLLGAPAARLDGVPEPAGQRARQTPLRVMPAATE